VSLAEAAALDRIFVRGLVLDLAIGVFAHERGRRQRVRFSAEVELPVGARGEEGYYSYDLIVEAIRAAEGRGHVELVETHAEEVAARILADARVAAVTVRVEKLDLGPEAAGVEIRRSR
jgi:dihydroneopterin aldolase